ncbi:hypothetical protein A9978_32320 [Pseudomonas sp. UMC65]|nr:hypothetical protein [Pseudomonas sp. UMC65]
MISAPNAVTRYHVQTWKLDGSEQQYAHGALGAVEVVRATAYDAAMKELEELRALLAKPAEQHQGEPVAWDIYWTDNGDFYFTLRNKGRLFKYADDADFRVVPLYTRPAEQPAPVAVALPEQWHPIETAPKDETEIILRKGDRVTAGAWIEWSKHHAEHHSTTGEYLGQVEYDSGANWGSWDGGFCEDDEPTHWQPLPNPPQQ